MRSRDKLGKRIIRAMQMDEIVDERDSFFMRGSSELTVREVVRFLHYSESEIRLSLREYVLKICGEGLYCSSYLGGVVIVYGDIDNLQIERRGGRKNAQGKK